MPARSAATAAESTKERLERRRAQLLNRRAELEELVAESPSVIDGVRRESLFDQSARAATKLRALRDKETAAREEIDASPRRCGRLTS